jgi:hypothetical protein
VAECSDPLDELRGDLAAILTFLEATRPPAALGRKRINTQGRPLALQPDRRPPDRPPQERHVLGDQQQADRQHLDPEHRQEPERAAEDEENPDREAYPARLGIA